MFIELTDPRGNPILINLGAVSYWAYDCDESPYVVLKCGALHVVQESLAEIKQELAAVGGIINE